MPRQAIAQLNSPIDVTLLRRFAAKTELAAGDPLYEFMRYVGADLLDYLRTARARVDFVARHVERWSLTQGDDVIEVVFLPRTEPAVDEPSAAVAGYVRAERLGSTVAGAACQARSRRKRPADPRKASEPDRVTTLITDPAERP